VKKREKREKREKQEHIINPKNQKGVINTKTKNQTTHFSFQSVNHNVHLA
jgi:hypothetical protein